VCRARSRAVLCRAWSRALLCCAAVAWEGDVALKVKVAISGEHF